MKNYVNKIEKDGKTRYTLGVKYTNQAGETKTGFVTANFSSKIEAPENKKFIQINSFMLGVDGGKPKVIVNNYTVVEKDATVAAPESAIARMWVNKNQFGRWQTSAKNEYNGNVTYANMSVNFKKGAEPTGDSAFIDVKDCFISGYENKEGAYVPTLVIMDYAPVAKADAAPVEAATSTAVPVDEDECPFDMD